MALKADLFMPMETFEGSMQTLADRVKQQPRAEGFDEILMPGEPEARSERERLASGIPLTRDVLESLQSEGRLVGIPFPSDHA
jgi:LDH2 family malate/lactate/ureidoglycolate dehydrogenase